MSYISRPKKAIKANKDNILRTGGPVFQKLLDLLDLLKSDKFNQLVRYVEISVEEGCGEEDILLFIDQLVDKIKNEVENGHDESKILDYLDDLLVENDLDEDDDEPCEPYTPLSTESSTDSTGYPFELTGWVVKPDQKSQEIEWVKVKDTNCHQGRC